MQITISRLKELINEELKSFQNQGLDEEETIEESPGHKRGEAGNKPGRRATLDSGERVELVSEDEQEESLEEQIASMVDSYLGEEPIPLRTKTGEVYAYAPPEEEPEWPPWQSGPTRALGPTPEERQEAAEQPARGPGSTVPGLYRGLLGLEEQIATMVDSYLVDLKEQLPIPPPPPTTEPAWPKEAPPAPAETETLPPPPKVEPPKPVVTEDDDDDEQGKPVPYKTARGETYAYGPPEKKGRRDPTRKGAKLVTLVGGEPVDVKEQKEDVKHKKGGPPEDVKHKKGGPREDKPEGNAPKEDKNESITNWYNKTLFESLTRKWTK